MSELGNRIAACRAMTGKTLRDVAVATGVAASTVMRVERGFDPSWTHGLALATWCDSVDGVKKTKCLHRFVCVWCGEDR